MYAEGFAYIVLILLITTLTSRFCCVHFAEKETQHSERQTCPSPPVGSYRGWISGCLIPTNSLCLLGDHESKELEGQRTQQPVKGMSSPRTEQEPKESTNVTKCKAGVRRVRAGGLCRPRVPAEQKLSASESRTGPPWAHRASSSPDTGPWAQMAAPSREARNMTTDRQRDGSWRSSNRPLTDADEETLSRRV